MSTGLTSVMINYFEEDPLAWQGSDFMKISKPQRAASAFINYLADEADDLESRVPMREDSMGLLGLLKYILKEDNFSAGDLEELGQVILSHAND